ncbi:MAG: NusG domain II-containing protein [Faecalibacterium sp.]|nr:NusG domain II-containing protein [Faecalibacterium sp.]
MKKNKTLLTNLLFAAVILALAAVLFGWRYWRNAASGAALEAKLTYGDDNTVLEIPLDKAADYDVDTGYYTVHIRVENGAARFVNSPCPDHICENYGWISAEDQSAICMPAHAVLMIVPKS